MPKYKSITSKNTKYIRAIFEEIEKVGKYRQTIRDKKNISNNKGETHDIFNWMEDGGIIKQTPDDMNNEKSPIFVEITEKGMGYFLFMKHFGIGL